MRIGVLAIQGDFAAHRKVLERLGAEVVEVRQPAALNDLDGLVLPGGESTTMIKFITDEGFADPIKEFAGSGKPIFGTCAGAILLAHEVRAPNQPSLDLLDITVERNAYGRQVDSFIGGVETAIEGGELEAVFIRAPRIVRVGPEIEVLATLHGEPVLVQWRNIMAATFHPELTNDARVHRLFANQCESVSRNSREAEDEALQVG
jgi:5'-phosphate synthase pdxT subunit